jgi:hypothetical protein
MSERNQYAPPQAEVGATSASSAGHVTHRVAVWCLAPLVIADLLFNATYAGFFAALARNGEIASLQLVGFLLATVLLCIGQVLLLLARKSTLWLWLALGISFASIFPAVWYNMVASTMLSAVGLLLAYLQPKKSDHEQINARTS